jgi:hypothetical protein
MLISKIQKLDPQATDELAEEFSVVWYGVVSQIVNEMLAYAEPHMGSLHINIREEMILELAKLTSFISDLVISERMNSRSVVEIDLIEERKACFSEEGKAAIFSTAKILAENIWIKIYKERWLPKTEFELKKDKEGRKPAKIVLRRVKDNHFIPKSFIRNYWAEGPSVYKSVKSTNTGLKPKIKTPFGSWGFLSNIYSDNLEAYFGLLEGDATQPLKMLLNVEPLNRPQREALTGFIVIQRIRNPHFMDSLKSGIYPVVEREVGVDLAIDKAYMQRVYEYIYSNNEFYDKLARPIMNSRWVIIRSKAPDFILPDVCNIFGSYQGKQYVLMPLTPHYCLVVLPVEMDQFRTFPHYIEASEAMIKNIAYILYSASKKEFLSAKQASLNFDIEKPEAVIENTISILITITTFAS